jgi:small-conductance mechanosensitive channel
VEAIDLVLQKLRVWEQDAILFLPNLAVAVVVVLAFWVAARVGRSVVRTVLSRLTISPEAADLLSGGVHAVMLLGGVAIALGILQLEKTVTSLMTGIGILGLTVGFALQDVASNMIAGLLIHLRQPFRVGDVIDTNEFAGRVDRITLRATEMTKLDGQFVLIPNKDIFNKPVINNSAAAARRVDIELPIPPDGDLKQTLTAAHAAIVRIGGRAQDREIELFFRTTGDGAVTLLARFWIASTSETAYLRAKSDAIQYLKRAFDARPAKETMPAQQRAG